MLLNASVMAIFTREDLSLVGRRETIEVVIKKACTAVWAAPVRVHLLLARPAVLFVSANEHPPFALSLVTNRTGLRFGARISIIRMPEIPFTNLPFVTVDPRSYCPAVALLKENPWLIFTLKREAVVRKQGRACPLTLNPCEGHRRK